ncbi:acetyl-CoA carboxylase biotin carboxylase subunit [Lawsonia intracellularis]|uniref:biotin carboxylase n=1 Tax=Lawsonia intracellularis (strain PHE/MN1-00) TaxID=363253 RepID=Q1MR34_LAWIP|nr:biotin carboxylase N-terminal domain-containing protein [Lawsonia intracellularis]AGC49901.1 carbamoyl-phosphate synthase subunit L domain-containing protein [Lawsonia intracellularis N343]KAA0205400.1 acetyl-CoA carboxylase biotin carboxylase subunit [Lawsonia intracellularis]MBZ3892061.1 acetyl-CoA carboxylase biotin carboxylase subunit [Lawsonia intracellularis]OMQ04663.1 acetyl-CoA carboxylase biotin carboxylase subunit [Lawsonia intracellularis]RBN32051.1 acetyl-CoA carboxylase biotin 
MKKIRHKVLIANRGEIAVRIAQACRKLGLDFVCVYTAEDLASGHVLMAKEFGTSQSLYKIASYHDANEILSIADESGATAIHPGYGFFAEDFRFARRVTTRTRNLIFIGPSWRVIRELGDKINTKRLARSLKVPTVPGSDKPIYDEMEAEKIARILYSFQVQQGIQRPLVLVKASAGGGGMGIEEVYDIDQFRAVYRRIRNYALRQFKDEGVLIEQRICNFSHLEVQIIADQSGKKPVHFGTRNCTIQSTGLQKRIEVAPGFYPQTIKYNFNAAKVLEDITNYSLTMAQKVGYNNVGTWEWIVTHKGNPFLMEVNTRIQVENGVSARIARIHGKDGVDLIAEQIRIALGEPLGYTQNDISFEGVGIEYRLIAEDPDCKFTPWVGCIDTFSWKDQPWLTMHTHVPTNKPYEIPVEFDPNLALAIIWGKDLAEAQQRGLKFLNQLSLKGKNQQGETLKSNIQFLKSNTERILQF